MEQNKTQVRDGDLVMLRLTNDDEPAYHKEHFNTWFRVLFIDNDETFIGKVERINRFEFTRYKINEHVKLSTSKIQHVYIDGEQFCYSDGIQICKCSGLCRDK